MRSMFELAGNFPAGFWSCDDCELDLYYKAPNNGMELVFLDIGYRTDLSATACTRCGYSPETGLVPLALDYV